MNCSIKVYLFFHADYKPLNIDRFNTSGLAQFHQLDKHYRVCGGKLQKTEGRAPVNKCTLHMAKLKSTFVVGVASDDPLIHSFSATLVMRQ